MTHYTQLDQKAIVEILSAYGINNVYSFKLLSGGSENTNYQVETDSGKLVLTICEQKSFDKTTELALLLNYFESNGFSSSQVLKDTQGKVVALWKDKPLMLKKFIVGEVIADFSQGQLTYLGKELAKLHGLEAPDCLPENLSYGIEKFDEVKVYAENSDFYIWLKNTQQYIESYMTPDLTKALIHSDIFYNNIIVSDDGKTATIMDFEEASYYYRIFDIGMMIVGTCCIGSVVSFEKISWLLKSYQQHNTLTEQELRSLQAFIVYGATATAFWRHQNYHYVNYNSEMTEHYLEMKNLADYFMDIPERKFQQLIGFSEESL